MQRPDNSHRSGGAITRGPERVFTKPLTDEFRRRLLEARAALLRTVALTDEELAALDRPQPSDPPEHAASASAASLLARLGGREKPELDDIADALHRLARGVYGVCESCGKPIPPRASAGASGGALLPGLPGLDGGVSMIPPRALLSGGTTPRRAGWPTTQSWDGRRRA
jgi:RNA polymerase-binding transcription factor DksA